MKRAEPRCKTPVGRKSKAAVDEDADDHTLSRPNKPFSRAEPPPSPCAAPARPIVYHDLVSQRAVDYNVTEGPAACGHMLILEEPPTVDDRQLHKPLRRRTVPPFFRSLVSLNLFGAPAAAPSAAPAEAGGDGAR